MRAAPRLPEKKKKAARGSLAQTQPLSPPCPCPVSQDPEGILAAPVGGHIQRRTFQKQVAESEEMQERVEAERAKAREELMAKRAARNPPAEARALVEYFLETETEELDYEVARTRPTLTEAFFKELDAEVGEFENGGEREKRFAWLTRVCVCGGGARCTPRAPCTPPAACRVRTHPSRALSRVLVSARNARPRQPLSSRPLFICSPPHPTLFLSPPHQARPGLRPS